MPTVIDVKNGSSKASISLQLIQNLLVTTKKFTLCYYVIADTLSDDWLAIIAASGIPRLGFTSLYGALCSDLSPGENTNIRHPVTGVATILWEVEATFDTNIREPTDNTPQVDWGGEVSESVLEFDRITGERITTSADEPIFVKVEDFYQTLTIRRLEDYPFNDTIPLIYNGTLNATAFYGRPRGTARMLPILGEETTIDNERKVWVTYAIKFKYIWNYDGSLMADSWKSHPLNQGYMVRPEIGATPIKNIDGRGNPIKCNLDVYGRKLVNGTGMDLKLLRYPAVGGLAETVVPVAWDTANGVISTQPNYPTIADIGSTLIITGGGGWTLGSYPIIGILTPPSSLDPLQPFWVIGPFQNPVASWPAADGATGGQYTLQRAPNYRSFFVGYYREFNALTLGPF